MSILGRKTVESRGAGSVGDIRATKEAGACGTMSKIWTSESDESELESIFISA